MTGYETKTGRDTAELPGVKDKSVGSGGQELGDHASSPERFIILHLCEHRSDKNLNACSSNSNIISENREKQQIISGKKADNKRKKS